MPLYRVEVSTVIYVDAPNKEAAKKCAVDSSVDYDPSFWDAAAEVVKTRQQIKSDGWLGCIPYRAERKTEDKKTEDYVDEA